MTGHVNFDGDKDSDLANRDAFCFCHEQFEFRPRSGLRESVVNPHEECLRFGFFD
jgi:hypothetical protein